MKSLETTLPTTEPSTDSSRMVALRPLCWVLVAVVLGVGGLLLAHDTSRALTVETSQKGVEAWLPVPYTKSMSDAQLAAVLDKAASAGVAGVHTQVDWSALEPSTDDSYDWDYMDRFVAFAKARGLKVTFQLVNHPGWAYSGDYWCPPTSGAELDLWRDFVHDLVARYGQRVTRYEMWNEPNGKTFWRSAGGPNPAEYAALLREGYLGAKAANGNVRVTGGTFAWNDMGYLDALYTELRKYPDAAANDDFFDELDVHPYSYVNESWAAPNVSEERTFKTSLGLRNTNFWGYRYMRDILVSHGDGHKKIYLGEFGYNTGPSWTAPITDEQRADWLKRAFMVANSSSSYISGLDWYSYYNDADRGYNIVDPDTLAETATFQALREVNTSGVTPLSVETFSLVPRADAFVSQASPTSNFGSSDTLAADEAEGASTVSFLSFQVPGTGTKTVQSATLRLHVKNDGGSADGPAVRRSANSWTEGAVTWNKRPGYTTPVQDDEGAVAGDSWLEFDVTYLVKGGETVTLAVQPTSSDGTFMHSRERLLARPQLVVTAATDAMSPAVTKGVPAGGTASVSPATNIVVDFSERMDKNTLTRANLKLYKVNANATTTQITNVTVSPSLDGRKATLNPYGTSATRLAKGTRYKAVVTTGTKDLTGNPLDQKPSVAGYQQMEWYFKTGTKP